jgi:hypothetical protein
LTPEWAVALLATGMSVAFYAWYASRGLTLAYNDAISHMMIARSVLASRHPGLSQLGSVWPPLAHVLMLPLIWNDTLFRAGFAGSLPSMVAYVVASVYMYRLGRLLFTSRVAGLVAALVFMLNPSMLYMQATPMTELDLNCALVLAVYYAMHWAQVEHPADLVKSAGAAAAATLVRYDGWALAAALALLVGYVAWRRWGRRGAESHLLLYGILAFAGCAGWLLYQQVIFGNALLFFTGPYSAQSQFNRDALRADTYHNPVLSAHVYGQAVLDGAWWPLAALSVVGLAWWVWCHGRRLRAAPAYSVLSPFAFNCLSMVMGITSLWTPEIAISGSRGYFNERFFLVMIPAIALFLAYLAVQRRVLLVAVLGLTLVFAVSQTALAPAYVLGDPLMGANAGGRVQYEQAAHWLAAHYYGGEVLVSYSPSAPLVFDTGLPDHDFIFDGDRSEFQEALAHPERYVTWVVIDTRADDPVWLALGHRQDWRRHFVLRATIGTTLVYERAGGNRG